MSNSSAPCLYTSPEGQRCYESVSDRGGYCLQHQPPAWNNSHYKATKEHLRNVPIVIAKYKGICYICGGKGADAVDHIIPKADGGTDSLGNLRPIHDKVYPNCHKEKIAKESQKEKELLWKSPRRGQSPF